MDEPPNLERIIARRFFDVLLHVFASELTVTLQSDLRAHELWQNKFR